MAPAPSAAAASAEVAALRRDLDAARGAAAQKDVVLLRAQGDVEDLQQQVAAKDRELDAAMARVRQLEAELSDMRSHSGMATDTAVESLRAELHSKDIDVEKLHAQLESKAEAVDVMQEEARMREALIAQYASQYEGLRAELSDAQRGIAERDEAIVSLRQVSEEAGSTFTLLQDRINEKDAALEQMRQQLEAALGDAAAARADASSARAEAVASAANEADARKAAAAAKKQAAASSASTSRKSGDGRGGGGGRGSGQRRGSSGGRSDSRRNGSADRGGEAGSRAQNGGGGSGNAVAAVPRNTFVIRRKTLEGRSLTIERTVGAPKAAAAPLRSAAGAGGARGRSGGGGSGGRGGRGGRGRGGGASDSDGSGDDIEVIIDSSSDEGGAGEGADDARRPSGDSSSKVFDAADKRRLKRGVAGQFGTSRPGARDDSGWLDDDTVPAAAPAGRKAPSFTGAVLAVSALGKWRRKAAARKQSMAALGGGRAGEAGGEGARRGGSRGRSAGKTRRLSDKDGRMTGAAMDSFLKSVPLFQSLSESQLTKLGSSVIHEEFTEGHLIIEQGEDGDKFYVIESGVVIVDIDGKELSRLSRGDFFGERALIKNEKRAASCIAAGPVRCLTIARDVFTSVLSGVRALLGDYVKNYSSDNQEVLSLTSHLQQFREIVAKARAIAAMGKGAMAGGGEERSTAAAAAVGDDSDEPDAEGMTGLDTSQLHTQRLLELMTAFSPELNVDDVIERVVKMIYALFGVDRVGLFLVNADENCLVLKVSKEQRGVKIPMTGIAGHVATTGETLNIDDCYKDARFNPAFDKKTGYYTRTMLCVPIYGSDPSNPLAVLQLINRKDGSVFSKIDETLLVTIGGLLGSTLDTLPSQMAMDEDDAFVPCWKTDDMFRVKVLRVSGQRIPRRRSTFGRLGGGQTFSVKMEVYHGRDLLSDHVLTSQHAVELVKRHRSSAAPESTASQGGGGAGDDDEDGEGKQRFVMLGAATFNEWLNSSVTVRNLPRAARVIFTVMGQGKNAVAWGGLHVYEFDQTMKSGQVELKLFPGACLTPMATTLSNRYGDDPGMLTVQFEDFGKPVIFTDYGQSYGDAALVSAPRKLPESHPVHAILATDPLHVMSDEERDTVYDARYDLVAIPDALPKFLSSVDWGNRDAVQEAYRLLYVWEQPGPLEALQLLDAKFPDPKVRAYAVSCIARLDDEKMATYTLQLTQVIKYETFHDSALARFLLRRALLNPYHVGHVLFWYLKAEMHIPDARDRFGVLLEQYLRSCGNHRTALGHQMFVMRKLEEVSLKVKECDSKESRREMARTELAKIVFPESFQLPLRPAFKAKGVLVEKCNVMNSKKLPLWLVFEAANPVDPAAAALEGAGGDEDDDGFAVPAAVSADDFASLRDPYYVMFKNGDDLRQDQLTLQVIRIMDQLWKAHGLDLRMSPYGCVSTGDMLGMLEIVRNSETIANVVNLAVDPALTGMKRKMEAAKMVYKVDVITLWLKEQTSKAGAGAGGGGGGGSGGGGGGGGGGGTATTAVTRHNTVAADTKTMRAHAAATSRALRSRSTPDEESSHGAGHGHSAGHSPSRSVVSDNASSYAHAQMEFAHSCAGYCAATFVLGIGDRHSDNIMINRDGRLFHIDFGHFLGNFKSKMGVKRERAPFVFTPAMAHTLGTTEGPAFRLFVKLSCKAFNILRKHATLLVTLFSLMTSCGIPELRTTDDIQWLREHLMLDLSDEEAADAFKAAIDESLHTKTTQMNDAAHMIRHA